ncbi:hypothetical protein C0416_03945 [bacterium]|nr:hypothetical protein [bacterium]
MILAVVLVITAVSIYFFGWWGLLSILLVPVIIGVYKGMHNEHAVTTDYASALEMGECAPLSFRAMQDILVKIGKEDSELDEDFHQLLTCLKTEIDFPKDATDKEIIVEFIQKFSKIFPNWQNEYSELTKAIDSKFS